MHRRDALLLLSPALLAACGGPVRPAAVTRPLDPRLLTCVPYARERSAIDLRGDGWQWWDAAAGRYERSRSPAPGAVLVFDRTRRLRDGHLAVVAAVVSAREIRVDHANWDSSRGGGPVSLDQPVLDVSPDNDWSLVRVWYPPGNHLGSSAFPARGFILPRPAGAELRRT